MYFINSGECDIIAKNGYVVAPVPCCLVLIALHHPASPSAIPILSVSVVAVLKTGDYFGELALLSRERRTATVRAQGYCDLSILTRMSLDRLLDLYVAQRPALCFVLFRFLFVLCSPTHSLCGILDLFCSVSFRRYPEMEPAMKKVAATRVTQWKKTMRAAERANRFAKSLLTRTRTRIKLKKDTESQRTLGADTTTSKPARVPPSGRAPSIAVVEPHTHSDDSDGDAGPVTAVTSDTDVTSPALDEAAGGSSVVRNPHASSSARTVSPKPPETAPPDTRPVSAEGRRVQLPPLRPKSQQSQRSRSRGSHRGSADGAGAVAGGGGGGGAEWEVVARTIADIDREQQESEGDQGAFGPGDALYTPPAASNGLPPSSRVSRLNLSANTRRRVHTNVRASLLAGAVESGAAVGLCFAVLCLPQTAESHVVCCRP